MAIKAFSVIPTQFSCPTLAMSTKKYMSIYDDYADQLKANDVSRFQGLEKYLRGEALAYLEQWKVLNDDHDYSYSKTDFCREFDVVSIDEARKGAAYRRQGENESIDDYSEAMLLGLG